MYDENGLVFISIYFNVGFFYRIPIIQKIADSGVTAELSFLYYFGISAIIFLLYLSFNKLPLTLEKGPFIIILIAAISGIIGNVFLFNSIKISPNSGYTLAIVGINTLMVFFSIYLLIQIRSYIN